ncbi:aspartate/methionine/tyrosine aminotransferase [Melghirimyces profundicolus]|uniref:Aminotransferase n=1 Tax=Melghirimyces profundicolus TaxID=1242148 RepID=A0A2T6BR66_9BACL|nr:aminotransferase class I/II-fold pyridoxal phosphate-dependent enzyme [Melghirimyces profundicolus]PTX58477.1 aspartate/methionine/tyrosine aminotransferase [Melghirimyces profundicolus]
MEITASRNIRKLKLGVFNELLERKRKLADKGQNMIDLSVGSPDLPPPSFVKEEIQTHAAVDTNYGYTMGAIPSFNRTVAEFYESRYGVRLEPGSEVLQLIGSQDGLAHLATALIDPGEVVLVPDPGYPIFEVGVHIAGGVPYPMPLLQENGYLPRLDRIPREVAEKSRLMVLNYPANPVAATADRSFFEEAVAFARRYDILIVHDFTYSELVFDREAGTSLLSIPGAKEVAVEFHSLSKTFNMAGCRVGFMTGNPQVLSIMATMISHTQYGIFHPIQKAAEAALTRGQEFIQRQRDIYRSRRDALVESLTANDWQVAKPPATMYVWAPTPDNQSSTEFVFRLMEETGVILTPGRAFGPQGEGCVRITLVQPEARLEEAAKRIGRFLAAGTRPAGSPG